MKLQASESLQGFLALLTSLVYDLVAGFGRLEDSREGWLGVGTLSAAGVWEAP